MVNIQEDCFLKFWPLFLWTELLRVFLYPRDTQFAFARTLCYHSSLLHNYYQFLWMALDALTHLSKGTEGFSVCDNNDQRWGLPDWSQSLWVWMNGWLVTVQDGSLTVISLCTLNFILTFSTSCGFSLPKRPLRIVLFLCYTDTEWQHDRFNSTPNTQLLSCLFVVNFVYFIIPGRGNKALYCNPYVYGQDGKS